MTGKKNDDMDTRGAIVVHPRVPPRGSFSLLLPPNMVWEEHPVAGGIRLDFRIRPIDCVSRRPGRVSYTGVGCSPRAIRRKTLAASRC